MTDPSRRSFLGWACRALGAVVAAVLGFPAAMYLVDPRHRKPPATGMRPVSGVRLSEVGSVPVQGVIRDVRRDAWTLHPNVVVGRVWVVRPGDGELRVFTTVCPHLGCSINCVAVPPVHFKCPCHDAEFETDGSRVHRPGYDNAAPRDMDSLAYEVSRDDPDLLLVEYKVFKAGQAVKEERT